MILKLNSSSVVVFDLDDTLYYEIDFVKSAFHHIASMIDPVKSELLSGEMIQLYYEKKDVFETIVTKYAIRQSKQELVNCYRNHMPSIKLNDDARQFLNQLKSFKIKMGVITDGRSITQRNKLIALDILDYFEEIVISEEIGFEKPSKEGYLLFEKKYSRNNFVFIGDNIRKDFIVPIQLKWKTIGILDKGWNIHQQDLNSNPLLLPANFVKYFSEIKIQYEG